jgi:hypothetical protein
MLILGTAGYGVGAESVLLLTIYARTIAVQVLAWP